MTILRSRRVCNYPDYDYPSPTECNTCTSNYISNNYNECVVKTCLTNFNKNSFDANQASCISPAKSTIATFSPIVPPSLF